MTHCARWACRFIVPCLLGLGACEGASPGITGSAGASAVQGVVECGPEFLNFRTGGEGIGLVSVGETMLAQTRVITASPPTPARFDNDWTVLFMDAQGRPLTDVEIVGACAYMPAPGHRHFEPPRRITREADPSTFKLEAINLSMRGPWEVQLAITSPTIGGTPTLETRCDNRERTLGADRIVIRTCVTDR